MSPIGRATGPLLIALLLGVLPTGAVAAASRKGAKTSAGATTFSFGQPQADTVGATGCATNGDGEPAIGGSDAWRALGGVGGPGADACRQAEYRGQPNAVAGTGASGGDIDLAVAPDK